MTTIYVRKLYDTLVPVDKISIEAMEKLKPNGEYKAELTQPRNYKFHKKVFALMHVAFDALQFTECEYQGQQVVKSFNQFRDDLTILAGSYDVVYNYKGDIRFEAKSWSFANMDEIEFQVLYSHLIDVILLKVLNNYTRDDLDNQVKIVLGFA
jgi:hypothetical protein